MPLQGTQPLYIRSLRLAALRKCQRGNPDRSPCEDSSFHASIIRYITVSVKILLCHAPKKALAGGGKDR